MMRVTGARIVVESLLKEKVDTLFGYIGGAVIPIFDELYQHGGLIRLVQPKHEQAGVHAADGYARATGKTGVVLVTSGPGATNTVTGIATAFMDSVPIVVITGQIASANIGTDAFQEADITGITTPITKANFLVKHIDQLALTIKKAFLIAAAGRPGPVLVDIPLDIQRQSTEFIYPEQTAAKPPGSGGRPCRDVLDAAWTMLQEADRPIVLAGGGVTFSDATAVVDAFIDEFGIPVVHTLMGHGVNPKDDDLYFGGIGMHGALYGNYALQHSDLIIALGTRFSDRVLGDPKKFAPHARIIQVDIDPAEIDKIRPIQLPIVGQVKTVVRAWLKMGSGGRRYQGWAKELKVYKQEHPLTYCAGGGLKPQYLLQLANRYFPPDTIVAADVGQNQMWTAQYFRFRKPRCFLASGGLGTMGYALPAAIGAGIGFPDREVLMVAGDGGFQMNLQELTTVRQYGLNLKMLVLDNSYLGMVRQWQELLCGKRYCGTPMDANPDFAKVGSAFGLKTRQISRNEEAEAAIAELASSSEAMLLHARIDPMENVLPMVPPGKSLDDAILQI